MTQIAKNSEICSRTLVRQLTAKAMKENRVKLSYGKSSTIKGRKGKSIYLLPK